MFRVGVLFSGGKDSTLSAAWSLYQGHDVVLLTIKPTDYNVLLHNPNVEWTRLQAQAMGLPHVMRESEEGKEVEVLRELVHTFHLDAIVTGGVESEFQRQRFQSLNDVCAVIAPLWLKRSSVLYELMSFMEIYVVRVAADGLGKEHLMARFPFPLPKHVHPLLEGGEGETFVVDAPFFNKRIVVDEVELEWDGVRGTAYITEAHLEEKL